jgi:hypothetical protein
MTQQEMNDLKAQVQALERKAEDQKALILEVAELAIKALRAAWGIADPKRTSDPERWGMRVST